MATVLRWSSIPGCDEVDVNDGGDQKYVAATARVRLEDVLAVLGDRAREGQLVDFRTPKLPGGGRKFSELRKQSTSNILAAVGSFRMGRVAAPLVTETFVHNGLSLAHSPEWSVQWAGPGMRDAEYTNLYDFQRVNHFPGSTELTRKDSMYTHLEEMSLVFGKEDFDFVPETYVLPEQAEEFKREYKRRGGFWIVKPANSACGKGIFMLRDASELENISRGTVVSQYVENPLLIQGLKFDLRVYVLVTQYEPLRAYMYREGLARFASAPYSTAPEHLGDIFRHLTNYSINKSAPNFQENKELQADNQGHKWSLSALNRHLRCCGTDVNLMWSRTMDLVVKTLLAVEPAIGAHVKRVEVPQGTCFEIYGFDVLVDDNLKPWIIEVNMCPSMATDSPLDWQVKSSLLTDALNLVGVCKADYRMVAASRLEYQEREKLRLARVRRQMLIKERGSSFSELPGAKAQARAASRRHSIGRRLGTATQAAKSWSIPTDPIVLDQLDEPELKMLARSLKEATRANNFIALYPTRETVERYGSIVDARGAPRKPRVGQMKARVSAGALLASVLFGPPPVQSSNMTEPPKAAPSEDGDRGQVLPSLERPSADRRVSGGRRNEASSSSPNSMRGEVVAEPLSPKLGKRPFSHHSVVSTVSTAHVPKDSDVDDSADGFSSSADDQSAPAHEDSAADSADPDASSDSDSVQEPPDAATSGSSASRALKDLADLPPRDGWRLMLMEYLLRISKACDTLRTGERARLAQSASFSRFSVFCVQLRVLASELPRTAGGNLLPERPDTDSGGLVDEISAACRSCLKASVFSEEWTLKSSPRATESSPAEMSPASRRSSKLMEYLPPDVARHAAILKVVQGLPLILDAVLEVCLRDLSGEDGIGAALDTLLQPFAELRGQRGARQGPTQWTSPIGELQHVRAHVKSAKGQDAGPPVRLWGFYGPGSPAVVFPLPARSAIGSFGLARPPSRPASGGSPSRVPDSRPVTPSAVSRPVAVATAQPLRARSASALVRRATSPSSIVHMEVLDPRRWPCALGEALAPVSIPSGGARENSGAFSSQGLGLHTALPPRRLPNLKKDA